MSELTPQVLAAMPLPRLEADGDKETRGRVLALAGSLEVPGAALVTGLAALRAGAGKLQIAVPPAIAPAIGVAVPEARVIGLADPPPGAEVLEAARRSDAVVVGPGWLDPAEALSIVRALAEAGGKAGVVIDAGALTCLDGDLVALRPFAGRGVLTPHAGEMADMLGCGKDQVEADPLAAGRAAAEASGCVVVMKGAVSFIVRPDGIAWRHTGGSVGLATSGSGDVLAGIVGGLMARGCEPAQAAAWGVAAHAAAGGRLARTVGEVGFLARELLAQIPWALSAPDRDADSAIAASGPPRPGLTGGCLCGAVRYRLASVPFDTGYCHCRMCQKFSGSPVMAFGTVPIGDFQLTAGTPATRRSSSFGERWFCRDCGSPLAMRVDDEPDTIDFTLASLDEPAATVPGFHIWRESRIAWFDTRDDLPRHPRKRSG